MQASNRKRFFLYKRCLCLFLASCIVYPASGFSDEKQLQKELEETKKKLATVTSDRDNVLKQAKNFLKEKEDAVKNFEAAKNSGSQTNVEVGASKKENEILKSDIERLRAVRATDLATYQKERSEMEAKLSDLEAKSSSIAHTLRDFPPEKIQELVADRNRLEEENKQMANRLIENEKTLQEIKRQMKPFELDREELNRLRAENKEIQKRMKYVGELEGRQKQLIQENAENREKVEVLKAKFKESVPGLAKAGRISQKMMRENADMHYNLGTIFLQNKQYKEAIREYEQVLELRPSDPETHYNLGVLYDDYVRDREKALYHYQKYLSVNPKAPDAKKVETYVLNLELEQKVR